MPARGRGTSATTGNTGDVGRWLARWAGAPCGYLTTIGRRSGRPHRIEISFAVADRCMSVLSGQRDRADWVQKLQANGQVAFEVGDETRAGAARVLEPDTEEDRLAREVPVARYRQRDILDEWVRMPEGPNGGGLSCKAILSKIDKSLARLGMDYVDLYIIHPWDYDTPIEGTMEALNDVVRFGKARYIGASAMFAWQFQNAQFVAEKKRPEPVRLYAEPSQPALWRGGTRDAAPLSRWRPPVTGEAASDSTVASNPRALTTEALESSP